ncbi:hypothetical protein M430DRAFT_36572 [Amorphotheca resinae ATCC 22711]|uniref:DUF7704 domain-containing protein n=1 Tax=Amorphotheca resinae ATCC 22711 TaxID=857342 RepID=A0A2T3AUV6_AMORE|nr:hypothetical protein M430DRAFT_36572 [Amorphotheca resinae ATCC 22711]PSS12446.1 hypothetical protein M430DRAFT_36572 [Amorphotheca resinae ATCC 22711]
MASILPPIPRVVFTVLEPLTLVAGFFAPFISPEWFVAEQIASSPLVDITQNTKMVAYQLGNIYILLAMIGVAVLYTTTEARVVRNYLIALAIADVSHVGVTWYAMGHERAVDVASWNSMTWGNIGVTTLLFVVRLAYLAGLFGPDQQSPIAKKGGKLH